MKDFVDKTSEQNGTPINRVNLMAIQGFENTQIKANANQIKETYGTGGTLTVIFSKGTIKRVFSEEKTITVNSNIDLANGTGDETLE